MDKRNKTALAYLLIGVAAAGPGLARRAGGCRHSGSFPHCAGAGRLPAAGGRGQTAHRVRCGGAGAGIDFKRRTERRRVGLAGTGAACGGPVAVLGRGAGAAAAVRQGGQQNAACRRCAGWPSTPWRIFCRPLPPSLPWPLWRSVSSCFGSPPA